MNLVGANENNLASFQSLLRALHKIPSAYYNWKYLEHPQRQNLKATLWGATIEDSDELLGCFGNLPGLLMAPGGEPLHATFMCDWYVSQAKQTATNRSDTLRAALLLLAAVSGSAPINIGMPTPDKTQRLIQSSGYRRVDGVVEWMRINRTFRFHRYRTSFVKALTKAAIDLAQQPSARASQSALALTVEPVTIGDWWAHAKSLPPPSVPSFVRSLPHFEWFLKMPNLASRNRRWFIWQVLDRRDPVAAVLAWLDTDFYRSRRARILDIQICDWKTDVLMSVIEAVTAELFRVGADYVLSQSSWPVSEAGHRAAGFQPYRQHPYFLFSNEHVLPDAPWHLTYLDRESVWVDMSTEVINKRSLSATHMTSSPSDHSTQFAAG